MHEKRRRSFAKGFTWRILATMTTMVAAFLVTGNGIISLEIGMIEFAAKLALYYFHERVWNRVAWGKHSLFHPR